MKKKFLYIINYANDDKSLMELEMKYIFDKEVEGKYILSDREVDPSRSQFIRERLEFMYEEDSIEKVIENIEHDNMAYEDFKVCFVKNETESIEYNMRLEIMKKIGLSINGEADIYNPKIEFGVTKLNGKWIFGEYKKHNNEWHIHDKKPYTYSNGLNFKVARSLVNIAAGNKLDSKIVDPCCGIGTVLMEGLSLGVNIKGYEINPLIGDNARRNLEFFDYENVVEVKDMHKVDEKYDASIIDIPYGLFNPITLEEQEEILKTARKISDKMVLIAYENMDDGVEKAGFKIVDRCDVSKGKFKRYVSVCVQDSRIY